jgi:hypothetical protein
MHTNSRFIVLIACVIACCVPASASDDSDPILTKAAQLFGTSLNLAHRVFPLNDSYVIWLVIDRHGDLFEVDVGPKSYYTDEFPRAKKPANPEYLSEAEYENALHRISELKDLGKLQKRHGTAIPSDFGPLNTDRFQRAFVERIVGVDQPDLLHGGEMVRKFNVYFLQDVWGSPEQVRTAEEQPMVCLVDEWYYLQPDNARRIHLGRWGKLQVAGPNLLGVGCVRTTPVYDADGFTIEEPQIVAIVVTEPYTVRVLAGMVSIDDSPVENVNVEVRRMGSQNVLRIKTNAAGVFSFSGVREGKYKFKVTKDGFKSLSGTIIVNHNADTEQLHFAIEVGT